MPLDELVRFAEKNLKEDNLRIARDAFKELVRLDKTRFLPLLLICYNRLAQKMILNKQVNEAQIVVNLIKELGGDAAVTVSIDNIHIGSASSDVVKSSLVDYFTSGNKMPTDLKFMAADWAIMNGSIPQETERSFFIDFSGVKQALSLVCENQFEKAVECIKPVSYDSAFSQWKLLIRGMVSYFTGDNSRAEMAFLKMSISTVPSKIAKSYLVLIDTSAHLNKDDTDREETLENACVLCGHPELKDSLPRAHYFWMTRRHRDSYLHIKKNLAKFPSIDDSVAGMLSNFYFNMIHHLNDKEFERYTSAIFDRADSFGEKSSIGDFLKVRALGIYSLKSCDCPNEELVGIWEQFFMEYSNIYGNDSQIKAEIYLMLAATIILRMTDDNRINGMGRDSFFKDDSSVAENCLQKALELLKSKEAYILLLQYYRLSSRKKDCRTLIEDAVKAFPNDKDLLCEAGMMAQQRSANNKAVEYFERAYRIDKIDPKLRNILTTTYIGLAKNVLVSKTGTSRMRSYMTKAELLCPLGVPGFLTESGYIAIRKAALEFVHGDEEQGLTDSKRANLLVSDKIKLDCFGLFVFRLYKVDVHHYLSMYETVEKTLLAEPKIDKAIAMIDVALFVSQMEEGNLFCDDFQRIYNYAIEAVKKDSFTPQDITMCCNAAQSMNNPSANKSMVNAALKRFPKHPLYRFLDYKNKVKRSFLPDYSKIKKDKKKLEAILADSQTLNDFETTNLIKKELDQLTQEENKAADMPFPFDPGFFGSDIPDFGSLFDSDDDFLSDPRQYKSRKKKKK
jgi:tetratricopeptide (TPR) repeat protein